jgi:hypothetical protein
MKNKLTCRLVQNDTEVETAAPPAACAQHGLAAGMQWTSATPIRGARTFHSQSMLADGRVLMCGGISGSSDKSTDAEIYYPETNAWTAAAPMQTAHAGHSQSTLADGRVLVCGGASKRGNPPTANVEIYNPETNTWAAAAPMRTARGFHSQSTLADGRVLLCGGSITPDPSSMIADAEILEGDELSGVGVIRIQRLPPVPSTDSMLQAEKAATLREWLAAAETIRLDAQLRLEDAQKKIEVRRDREVAEARKWFDRSVRQLEQRLQERVTATNAACDRQLERCGVSKLEEVEQAITRIRRQAEEAEQLTALLEGGASPTVSSPHAPSSHRPPSAGAASPRERPDEHFCPITTEVMRDPVMIGCGDTFERSAIEEWFKGHDTCPFCREQSNKVLMPNKVVKKMIQDWQA